jgi:hypothetical protein
VHPPITRSCLSNRSVTPSAGYPVTKTEPPLQIGHPPIGLQNLPPVSGRPTLIPLELAQDLGRAVDGKEAAVVEPLHLDEHQPPAAGVVPAQVDAVLAPARPGELDLLVQNGAAAAAVPDDAVDQIELGLRGHAGLVRV